MLRDTFPPMTTITVKVAVSDHQRIVATAQEKGHKTLSPFLRELLHLGLDAVTDGGDSRRDREAKHE